MTILSFMIQMNYIFFPFSFQCKKTKKKKLLILQPHTNEMKKKHKKRHLMVFAFRYAKKMADILSGMLKKIHTHNIKILSFIYFFLKFDWKYKNKKLFTHLEYTIISSTLGSWNIFKIYYLITPQKTKIIKNH